jgi:hypothetical protein
VHSQQPLQEEKVEKRRRRWRRRAKVELLVWARRVCTVHPSSTLCLWMGE